MDKNYCLLLYNDIIRVIIFAIYLRVCKKYSYKSLVPKTLAVPIVLSGKDKAVTS